MKAKLYINGITFESTRDFETAKSWDSDDAEFQYSAWNPKESISVIFFGNVDAALEFVRNHYRAGFTDVWGIARAIMV